LKPNNVKIISILFSVKFYILVTLTNCNKKSKLTPFFRNHTLFLLSDTSPNLSLIFVLLNTKKELTKSCTIIKKKWKLYSNFDNVKCFKNCQSDSLAFQENFKVYLKNCHSVQCKYVNNISFNAKKNRTKPITWWLSLLREASIK
jgi:hypothetical protein